MEIETLIHMANRIGAFFEALPDRQEGLDGVAEHLKRYWEPRMRRRLLAFVESGESLPESRQGGHGVVEQLSPFVRKAIELHLDALTPAMPSAEAA